MPNYHYKRVRELVRELMLGPADVRRVQAVRLERLLIELDPDKAYPYDFLYFRITGFRLRGEPPETLRGADLLPDMTRALDEISESVPQDARTAGERVFSLDELARRFHVSERTVRRWRRSGLVGAAYRFPRGRSQVGVRQSALDAFLARSKGKVAEAKDFSRVSEDEEERIIELARARTAGDENATPTSVANATPTSVANAIAAEAGRAPETVRQALLRHDAEHPEAALFPEPGSPRIRAAERRRIYEALRRGASVEELCERYGRSRASLYRIVNQARADELRGESASFIHDEAFAEPDAEERILGRDLRVLLERLDRQLAEAPLSVELTKPEEALLLRAHHYCRCRAEELRRQLNPRRYVRSRMLRRIEALEARANGLRDRLVRALEPVLQKVARQHTAGGPAMPRALEVARRELPRLVAEFDYRTRARLAKFVGLELMKAFARELGDA